MSTVKRYGQFCALARALDEVGDRWTLLVIRELLVEPVTYTVLRDRLPGVATNLLAERLARLQILELAGRDATTRRYALTERGQALRPVVHELIRWGAPLMLGGPGDDVVDARWAALALEALLDDPGVLGPPTCVVLRCGETTVTVRIDGEGRHVTQAAADSSPDAVLTGSLPHLLAAVHAGRLEGVAVTGSRAAARRALSRPVTATARE